jgi:hypothetical protein
LDSGAARAFGQSSDPAARRLRHRGYASDGRNLDVVKRPQRSILGLCQIAESLTEQNLGSGIEPKHENHDSTERPVRGAVMIEEMQVHAESL